MREVDFQRPTNDLRPSDAFRRGRLRQTAASEGITRAEIVRRALEVYLPHPIQAREATIRARATELIGAFSSGLTDVSEDHDRYLAETILEDNESTDLP